MCRFNLGPHHEGKSMGITYAKEGKTIPCNEHQAVHGAREPHDEEDIRVSTFLRRPWLCAWKDIHVLMAALTYLAGGGQNEA